MVGTAAMMVTLVFLHRLEHFVKGGLPALGSGMQTSLEAVLQLRAWQGSGQNCGTGENTQIGVHASRRHLLWRFARFWRHTNPFLHRQDMETTLAWLIQAPFGVPVVPPE